MKTAGNEVWMKNSKSVMLVIKMPAAAFAWWTL
ncbi:hypothetical protein RJ641_029141 [Dillenia turbinata]|uniref:Uncharacterized protein n=1 Tax=Dillenia turbinata TaxID=194707 RepID=A0AAN8VSY5_9MAGN